MTSAPAQAAPGGLKMTHGQVLRALTGLLLGMFVTMLANTLVSTSMPRIIADLDGTLNQTHYTWVLTATLLATTISTPIWGKLADLTNRKVLLQISLVLFVVATAAAGFSQSSEMLIACRVFQGMGAGGMQALSQIVMADILSPRERGKYMGLFGGVMALATVGGPLIGGWVTDTFSWHWNFFLSLPFAALALIMLQKTLHLPDLKHQGKTKIDYLGIVLLSAGVSLLLIWVSLAGNDTAVAAGQKQFAWASAQTVWMLAGSAVLLIAFVITELRVADPLIRLALFKNRTFTLSTIGSVAVGVAMFGCTVYLSQLFIMSRGATPSEAGLMTIPMMAGMLVISTLVGAIITRTGVWKPYMIFGGVLLIGAMYLIGTTHYDTAYWILGSYMFLMGAGVGMIMQNLVLVVQNAVNPQDLGVATSTVSFFRTMGGTLGVSWLGALLANKVPELLQDRTSDLKAALMQLAQQDPAAAKGFQDAMTSGKIPNPGDMPGAIRPIFESIYGDGIAHLFTMAAPIAIITLICIIFLPNLSLSQKTRSERQATEDLGTGSMPVFAQTATGAVPVVTVAEGSSQPGTSSVATAVAERPADGSPVPDDAASSGADASGEASSEGSAEASVDASVGAASLEDSAHEGEHAAAVPTDAALSGSHLSGDHGKHEAGEEHGKHAAPVDPVTGEPAAAEPIASEASAESVESPEGDGTEGDEQHGRHL